MRSSAATTVDPIDAVGHRQPGLDPVERNGRWPEAVAVLGCVLLVARPALVAATHRRIPVLLAVFAAVGLVGLVWPLPRHGSTVLRGAAPWRGGGFMAQSGPIRLLCATKPPGRPPSAGVGGSWRGGSWRGGSWRGGSWRGGSGRASWPTSLVVLGIGLVAFSLGRLLGGGRSPAPFTAGVVAANSLAALAEEAFFRRFVYGLLRPSGAAWAIGGSAALFAAVHVTTYGYWVLPIDLAAGLLLGWQRWSSDSWAVPSFTHVVANVMVVI